MLKMMIIKRLLLSLFEMYVYFLSILILTCF